jgi:retron-type reverse transcriptase
MHPTALHPQTGEPGKASTGDSNGPRPGGANGTAHGAGADLRAGLCSAQLRLSPQTGCKDALRRVDELLKAGYIHVVDADLKSYFDMIPKDRLLALIGQKVSDGRILNLVKAFLEQKVLDGLEEWTPEQGTPQGAVCSPLLSNIYLDPLDHLMAERSFEMVATPTTLWCCVAARRTRPQPWRQCSAGRRKPA